MISILVISRYAAPPYPAAPSTLTPIRACQPLGILESTAPGPDRAIGAHFHPLNPGHAVAQRSGPAGAMAPADV